MDAVIVVLPAHAWQEFNARCQDRPRLAAQFVAVAAGNATAPGGEWLVTKDRAAPLTDQPEHLTVTLQRLRVVLNWLAAFASYEREMAKAVPEIAQDVATRQALAAEARTRILGPPESPEPEGDPPRAVPDQDPDRP
jgi:hypothetical protein